MSSDANYKILGGPYTDCGQGRTAGTVNTVHMSKITELAARQKGNSDRWKSWQLSVTIEHTGRDSEKIPAAIRQLP